MKTENNNCYATPDHTHRYHITKKSANIKVGAIPVTTSTAAHCPIVCPFNDGGGCYAGSGPLCIHWRKVTAGDRGTDYNTFCDDVAAFPVNTFWRHNQAGDVVGDTILIDRPALQKLTAANSGRRGYTYTHYDMTILSNIKAVQEANDNGFTVNLSGNNLDHADELKALDVGPVVCVIPEGTKRSFKTAAGNTVVVCPAAVDAVKDCDHCRLCQNVDRKVIIGLPVHGSGKKRAAAAAGI